MDARIFDLIDSINREGLTDSEWGLAPRVVNSKYYFGVEEDVKFPGQVLYIYGKNLEDYAYGGLSNPDAVLTVKDSPDEKVFVWNI